jgi:RNA polymerase sigma factor (sigma-70 family)
METSDECFKEVIEGLRANRPEAFARLWREFYAGLVKYADRKLAALPRRSSDEEDIAQAAMQSLHVGLQKGHFPEVTTKEDLARLLYVITDREAKQEIRKQKAAKRGGGTVRGESVFFPMGEDAGFHQIADGGSSSPLSNQLPLGCSEMLDRLEDDLQRRIVMLKFQGYDTHEIAEAMGVADRTIERRLVRVREILGDELFEKFGEKNEK